MHTFAMPRGMVHSRCPECKHWINEESLSKKIKIPDEYCKDCYETTYLCPFCEKSCCNTIFIYICQFHVQRI